MDHKILQSLLRFARRSVEASIDGHGTVYEYVRYPARADIVERNLRLVRTLTRENSRLSLILNTLGPPYNCLNLVDLLRFADDRRGFADFTRDLDASRKQSLGDSVPELAAFLPRGA